MKLLLIFIGWVVFVSFIIVFNYGAHRNEPDSDEEPDNIRQLFPPDDKDEHLIF